MKRLNSQNIIRYLKTLLLLINTDNTARNTLKRIFKIVFNIILEILINKIIKPVIGRYTE